MATDQEGNNADFKELVKLMALGSKASFSYQPSDEEIILFLTKQVTLPKPKEGQTQIEAIPRDLKDDVCDILIEAEKSLPIKDKRVQGDASETGVVKFVQTLNDIEETRATYPVHNYIDNNTRVQVDCAIPFSSEIKFNLFVRDMRADANGHLSVIMKGAPERILNRCSNILINGKVVPFDGDLQA